jgi:hypothetical protein
MENDAGILPEDFILKPVRHTELIDWLERRLALKWRYHEANELDSPPVRSALPPRICPAASQLAALLEVVNLGFYRGIMNTLAEIERQQPATAVFVNEMRVLARQFQFEAMGRQLANKETGHEQRA